MDTSKHAFCLLQGIPNNDEWKLFKQLIRSQHLKSAASTGASGSTEEIGLERDPARLVTMMLDEEANILKDCGGDKNMVLYSGTGSKNAKKSKGTAKNPQSTTVSEVDKDIECYGCHKKGHKRSECPDKKKKAKENSGKPTSAAASMASGNNTLWMATVADSSSHTQRTMQDWYIDSACSQHVTGTKEYFIDYRDDQRVLTAFNGSDVVAEGHEDVQVTMKPPNGQERGMRV